MRGSRAPKPRLLVEVRCLSAPAILTLTAVSAFLVPPHLELTISGGRTWPSWRTSRARAARSGGCKGPRSGPAAAPWALLSRRGLPTSPAAATARLASAKDGQQQGGDADAGGEEGSGASSVDRLREQLARSFGKSVGAEEDGPWARQIQDPSSAPVGAVLLGHPKAFATGALRAGAGVAGMFRGPTSWMLRLASFLGNAGLMLLDGLPDSSKSRFLPVVLLLERNADGSGRGVALTSRTGMLLGDTDRPLAAFMTRPLHWGGPADGRLFLLHPYPEVAAGVKLGSSGLYAGGSLASAQAWVQEGQGASIRFRFFVGAVQWGAGELDRELSGGVWIPLQCASEFILDESERLGSKPLWSRLAEAAGGSALAAGQDYGFM